MNKVFAYEIIKTLVTDYHKFFGGPPDWITVPEVVYGCVILGDTNPMPVNVRLLGLDYLGDDYKGRTIFVKEGDNHEDWILESSEKIFPFKRRMEITTEQALDRYALI